MGPWRKSCDERLLATPLRRRWLAKPSRARRCAHGQAGAEGSATTQAAWRQTSPLQDSRRHEVLQVVCHAPDLECPVHHYKVDQAATSGVSAGIIADDVANDTNTITDIITETNLPSEDTVPFDNLGTHSCGQIARSVTSFAAEPAPTGLD